MPNYLYEVHRGQQKKKGILKSARSKKTKKKTIQISRVKKQKFVKLNYQLKSIITDKKKIDRNKRNFVNWFQA